MDLQEIKNVENISLKEFFNRIENNQLFIELSKKDNVDNVFRRFLKSYIPREAGRISDVFSQESIERIKRSIIEFETLNLIQKGDRTVRINRGTKDPLDMLNVDSFKKTLIENLKKMNDKEIESFFGGEFENVLKAYEKIELEDIKEIIKNDYINDNIETFLNIIKLKFEYIGDTFQGKINDVKQKHLANYEGIKKNIYNDFEPFIDDLVKTIESFGGNDYKENIIEIRSLIDKILKSSRKVIEEKMEIFEKKIGYATTLYLILMNENLSLKEKIKEIQDLNKIAKEEIDEYFELVNFAEEYIKKLDEKEVFERVIKGIGKALETNKKLNFSDVPFLTELIENISNGSIIKEVEDIILSKSEPEIFTARLRGLYEKYKDYNYITPYEEMLIEISQNYSNDIFHEEFANNLQDFLYRQIDESEEFKNLVNKYKDKFIVANKFSTQFLHKLFQESYEEAVKNGDEKFSNFYIAEYLHYKTLVAEKVDNDYYNLYKFVEANKKGQNLLAEILTDENFAVLDTPTKKEIVRDIMDFIKQEWEKGVENQSIKNDFLAFYEDAGEIVSLIRELHNYDLLEDEYIEFLEEINNYFDLYADDKTYIRNMYAKISLNELTYQSLKDTQKEKIEKMSYEEFSNYLDKKIIQDKSFGKDIFNVILVEAKNKAIQEFFDNKESIKENLEGYLTKEIVNREINKRIIDNIKIFYKTELEFMVSKTGNETMITDIEEYIENIINKIVLQQTSLEQLTPKEFIEKLFEKYSNTRSLRKLNERFLKEKIDDDYVLMAIKQQALTSFKDIDKRFLEIAHKELNNATGQFREELLKLPDEKVALIRDKIASILRGIPDKYEEELEKTVQYLKTELSLTEGEIRNYLLNMTEPYKSNKKSLLADIDVVLAGDEKEQADLIASNLKITKKGDIRPPEEDYKNEKEFEEDFAKFLSMKSSQFVQDKRQDIDTGFKEKAINFVNKRISPDINSESFSKYAIIGKEGLTLDVSYKTLSKNIDTAMRQKNSSKLFEDTLENITFRGQMLLSMAPFFTNLVNMLKTESQQLKEVIEKNQKIIVKNNYLKHDANTLMATAKTMAGAIPVAMLIAQDLKSVVFWMAGLHKQPTLEEIDSKLRKIKTIKGVYSKMKFLQIQKDKNPFSVLQTIEEHLRYKRERIVEKVAINKQHLRRITATLKNFNDISEYVIQNAPANSSHLANVIKELTNEGEYKIFRKKFKKIDNLITKATEMEYSNDIGQREKERLRNIIYKEYERNQELRKKAMFRAYEVAFTSKNPREQIEILQNIKNNDVLTHEQKEELLEQVKTKMLENIKTDTMGSVFLLLDEDFINLPKVQKFLTKIDLDSNPVEGLDDFTNLIENRILKSALTSEGNNLNLKDLKTIMEKKNIKNYDKDEIAELIKELREALKVAISEIKTFEDLERIMDVKLSLLEEKEQKSLEKVKSVSKLQALGKAYSKFAKLSPYTFKNFLKDLQKYSLADKAIQDVILKNVQSFTSFKENMYKLIGEVDPENELLLENKLREMFERNGGDLRTSFEELVGVSIEDYYVANLEKLSILTEETLRQYPKVFKKVEELSLEDGVKNYVNKRLLELLLKKDEETIEKEFDKLINNILQEVKDVDWKEIEKENVELINSILEILNARKVEKVDKVEDGLDKLADTLEEKKKQEEEKGILNRFKNFLSLKEEVIKNLIKENFTTKVTNIEDSIDEKQEKLSNKKNYKIKSIIKVFDSYQIPCPVKDELYEFIEKNDLNKEETYSQLVEKLKNLLIRNPEELASYIKKEKDYINLQQYPFNKELEAKSVIHNIEILKSNDKTRKLLDNLIINIDKSSLSEYKNRILNDIVKIFKTSKEEVSLTNLQRELDYCYRIDPKTTEKIVETVFKNKGMLLMLGKQFQEFKPLSPQEIEQISNNQKQQQDSRKESTNEQGSSQTTKQSSGMSR